MMEIEEFNVDVNGTSRDDKGREYVLVILDKFDANDNPVGHKWYYMLGDFHEELEDIVFLRELWNKPKSTKVVKVTKIYEIN